MVRIFNFNRNRQAAYLEFGLLSLTLDDVIVFEGSFVVAPGRVCPAAAGRRRRVDPFCVP